MPKLVYVRGHYRRTRRTKVPLLLIVAVVLILVGAYWVETDPISFSAMLGCVLLAVVGVVLIRRRNHAVLPESMPVVQSRYIPEHIKRAVMGRDNYRCRYCGSNLYPEIDHIIPLSRGGTNDPSNLQVLCRGCNAQKGARV